MVFSKSAPPRWRKPVVAAGILAGLALIVSGCSSSTAGSGGSSAGRVSSAGGSSGGTSSTATKSAAPSTTAPPAQKVHVSGYPDGSTVGVGMPIIATFNRKITSGVDFAKHAKVTVNGQPVNGGWYFEYSARSSGHAMEAHYRLQNYWPAHARVHVAFALAGVSPGRGLVFDGKLTSLDFQTGARNIGVVDDSSKTLTINSDGRNYGRFPVSLGADQTPTFHGTKVIMEQLKTTCMHDTNYHYNECGIKWDQRLTYSGEYLHAAPWNVGNIGHRDTSNGCTNLLPADALKLYNFLHIGDIVQYPNANGPAMTMGAGYGDWNVPWVEWQTGGAVPVS